MIEARPSAKTIREWQDRVLEEMGLETDAKMRGVTRLLLRPPGRSAKRVYIDKYHKSRAWRVLGKYEWRLTRAQAAQAAYA